MISVQSNSEATLEADVDADIAAFDEWFQRLGNEPLLKSEKAMVKTWIWWKVRGTGQGAKDGA
jgi:hypothetical protein